MSSKSLSGAEYFVTFIDDKTRYVQVYIIKRKLTRSSVFVSGEVWSSNNLEKCQVFWTDNGGEFTWY